MMWNNHISSVYVPSVSNKKEHLESNSKGK